MNLFNLTNRDIYLIYSTFKSMREKYEDTFISGKSSVQVKVFGMPATAIVSLSEEELEKAKQSPCYLQTVHVEETLKPIAELIESSDEFDSMKELKFQKNPEFWDEEEDDEY